MELYFKKRRWKLLLLLIAMLIGASSLIYTNWLIGQMSKQERKSVELWAEAMKRLVDVGNGSNQDLTFLQDIMEDNTTIPIIYTDEAGTILGDRNISYTEKRKAIVLQHELEKMKGQKAPIEVVLSEEMKQYLYYRDSNLLQNLRYFPLAQFGVIMLFIIVSYFAFSSSRKAEQNQVWVGMSKETAHQLGTPISSLMAWVELLKMKQIDQELIAEIEKDVSRLEKITERFSKIGSAPELVVADLKHVLQTTVSYLQNRSSQKVRFQLEVDNEQSYDVPHNAALFSWVIENLCKNAVDAIESDGIIRLQLSKNSKQTILDISDNGKGIPKSQYKTVFEPGYTTKKRGWGLGLSLARRIIENYHQGKIALKHSEIGRGTTFRIVLPNA
ncbi:HAMP domain-containing sensor histidine kinase [uncultured Sunxiuqinia sp.]|uniref:sensor histidine kinase n=1 Tax=uncultured Sunxiuqinia sp. TaxID=1573825 RepID=UPI00262AF7CA|nr:HAMP domain-containing sensor histidine kinase [uncultured Sunxiuqinia sp.]